MLPARAGAGGGRGVCSGGAGGGGRGGRARDAIGAARWLDSQALAARGRIGVMGWSNGGSTVLRLIERKEAAELFSAAVAFYPGCRDAAECRLACFDVCSCCSAWCYCCDACYCCPW